MAHEVEEIRLVRQAARELQRHPHIRWHRHGQAQSPRVLLGALLLLIMLGTYWLLFGLGVVNFRISPIQRSNLTGTETWLL